jgi:hypothetical protein
MDNIRRRAVQNVRTARLARILAPARLVNLVRLENLPEQGLQHVRIARPERILVRARLVSLVRLDNLRLQVPPLASTVLVIRMSSKMRTASVRAPVTPASQGPTARALPVKSESTRTRLGAWRARAVPRAPRRYSAAATWPVTACATQGTPAPTTRRFATLVDVVVLSTGARKLDALMPAHATRAVRVRRHVV